jgi:hypothetical protein
MDLVEMALEGSTVDEPFDTQGALVDVWEMCLHVKGSLERVVRPIDTVGTGVAAAGSQELRLMHALGGRSERSGE